MYLLPDRTLMTVLLALLMVMCYIFDHRNLQKITWVRYLFTRFFNPMLGEKELAGQLTGATWVCTAMFFTVLIFPADIAVYALLIMTVGDPVAAIVGSHFNKIRIFNKTLVGSLAGVFACLVVSFLVPSIPFKLAAVGALAGMTVELLPLPINDNISIPLVSGTILYFSRIMIG